MKINVEAASHITEQATPLINWLMDKGLQGASQEELLNGYCRRLTEMDVPLFRFHLAQRAFHPHFGGIGFSWTRDEGFSQQHYQYRATPADEWIKSPFYFMLANKLEEFRARLEGQDDDQVAVFPILSELREMGVTDYFTSGLLFESGKEPTVDPNTMPEGLMVSWSADRAGGFTDADLEIIRSSLPYLGLALKSSSNRQMATDLLKVYLGRDAGRRVLSGEIQRGSSQKIDAVICYFDLNGFTALSEQIPGPELIEMLNDYFGLAVATIQEHGGNILKFMGDGMLTMFDLGSIEADATAALNAVKSLQAGMRQLNAQREEDGLPTTGFTLALHAGEILYGNIGAENRLDFTVIGPTVNVAARISDMHRSVGQNIIMSEEVQRAAQPTSHDLVSLGRYMVRGVGTPIELYTIYDNPQIAA